jgi:hypothetical protein
MRVVTAPTDPASLREPKTVVGVVLALVALLGVFTAAGLLVRSPTFVDHVTIVNRTRYDLGVDVRGGSSGGVLLLTAVQPFETVQVDDVLDQGSPWTFDLSRGGTSVGAIRVRRTDLERQGWRVVLPTPSNKRWRIAVSRRHRAPTD